MKFERAKKSKTLKKVGGNKDRHIYRQRETDRQIDIQNKGLKIEGQTERQTFRQRNRHLDSDTEEKTIMQANIETFRQTRTHTSTDLQKHLTLTF